MDVEVATLPDIVPVMNWDLTGCEQPDTFLDTSTGWNIHSVIYTNSLMQYL